MILLDFGAAGTWICHFYIHVKNKYTSFPLLFEIKLEGYEY